MIERSHLVALLLVAMLGLAGCAETGVAAPDAATRESARINEFFARAFEERLALRP